MEFVALVLSRNFQGGTCRRNRRRNPGGNCCRLLLGPWRGMCTTGSSPDPAVVNHFSCLLVVTSPVGHCTYYSHTPSEAPVFFLCTQKPCQSSSREVVNVVLLLSQFSRAHLCRINSVCALSAAKWAVLVDQSTSEPMRKRFKSLRGKETSRMNVFLFDSFGDS